MNWSDFFAMGGYALYVWGSYVAAAVVLVANLWWPLRQRTAVRQNLREFFRLRDPQQ